MIAYATLAGVVGVVAALWLLCRHIEAALRRMSGIHAGRIEEERLAFAREREAWLDGAEVRDATLHWLSEQVEAAARERRELLTRIQAWEPGPEPEPAAPSAGSQAVGSTEEYSREELAERRIQLNGAGGFIDLDCGVLFETVADIEAHRRALEDRGLPASTKPHELELISEP